MDPRDGIALDIQYTHLDEVYNNLNSRRLQLCSVDSLMQHSLESSA